MFVFYRIKSLSALIKETLSGYIRIKRNAVFPHIQKKMKTFLQNIFYIFCQRQMVKKKFILLSRT